MTKRAILTILTTSFISFSWAQNAVIDIAGSDNTLPVNIVTFEDNASSYVELEKTNGSFIFTAPDTTKTYYLYIPFGLSYSQLTTLKLVLAPGDNVLVTGELNQMMLRYDIQGSQLYKNYNRNRKKYVDFETGLNNASDKLAMLPDDASIAQKNKCKTDIDWYRSRYNAILMELIQQNPQDPIVTLYYAECPYTSIEQCLEQYKSIGQNVRNGRYKSYLDYTYGNLKHDSNLAKAKTRIGTGKTAPGFALEDLDGQVDKLSSMRGRYVVLYFWGSWCDWCTRDFDSLKYYYNRYKGKLEIIGINCGDTKTQWREAIEQYELPWRQLFGGNSGTEVEYAVEGYPTRVIINPRGTIVAIIAGDDPDDILGKKLRELLRH